jgi:hypothetical protein
MGEAPEEDGTGGKDEMTCGRCDLRSVKEAIDKGNLKPTDDTPCRWCHDGSEEQITVPVLYFEANLVMNGRRVHRIRTR